MMQLRIWRYLWMNHTVLMKKRDDC